MKNQAKLQYMIRLNKNSNTFEEVVEYYKERHLQLASDNVKILYIEEYDIGVHVVLQYGVFNKLYSSIYVYKKFRGNDSYIKLYDKIKNKYDIFTTPDCDLVDYLKYKNIPHYVLYNTYTDLIEYTLIQNEYKSDVAKRSGVYLMNHIDEGIYILHNMGASMLAIRAYIIHPLFQSDDMLLKNQNTTRFNESVIMRAMEYRNIANQYLSKRKITDINEIVLSPIKDVNDMLIADKIQNYKDFMKYHFGIHERSEELYKYFHNWFKRLDITPLQLFYYIEELNNLREIKCIRQ